MDVVKMAQISVIFWVLCCVVGPAVVIGDRRNERVICPSVNIKNGDVIIHHGSDESYEIEANGLIKKGKGPHPSGKWYGLVTVTTDECRQAFSSEHSECDRCMLCFHNTGIHECFPYMVSLSLGLMLGVLTLLFLLIIWKFMLTNMWNKFRMRRQELHDDYPPQSGDSSPKTEIMGCEIIPGPDQESTPTLKKTAAMLDLIKPNLKSSHRISTPPVTIPMVLLLLACMGGFETNGTPNNVTCQGVPILMGQSGCSKPCNSSAPILLTLQTGVSMCLRAHNKSVESLELKKTRRICTYSQSYVTSDYSLVPIHRMNCLGSGNCTGTLCDNHTTSCRPEGDDCKNTLRFVTCMREYQMGCGYLERCVWSGFDVVRIGVLYRVYELMGCRTEIELAHAHGEGEEVVVIDSQTPLAIGDHSINIVSYMQEENSNRDSIVCSTVNCKWVKTVSPLGMPVVGLIGDLQRGILDHDDWLFAWGGVLISSGKYSTRLRGGAPSLERLWPYLEGLKGITVDDQIIKVSVPTNAKISLLLSTNGEPTFQPDGECDVNFISSIGCSGCIEPATIIVKSTAISKPGLMPIQSNCTLQSSHITCANILTHIQISEAVSGQRCKICGPKFCKTIELTLKFRKPLKEISEKTWISGEDSQQATWDFKSLFSNWHFPIGFSSASVISILAFFVVIPLVKHFLC